MFYELHIGTFTPEGSFAAAQQRLPELEAEEARLGGELVDLLGWCEAWGRLPDGTATVKAESDDLTAIDSLAARRAAKAG